MYHKTTLRCPVCKKVMDVITGPGEQTGMGEAMLGGDSRREHAKSYPECVGKPGWERGWDSSMEMYEGEFKS